MKKGLFLAGAVFSLCLSLANATSIITLDKTKVRLRIAAGSSKSGFILLENSSGQPKHVKIYLQDWRYNNQDGPKDFLPSGTTEFSCASWISFLPAELNLPAYSKQKINFSVSVPAEAQGGHYAIMFFEESQPPNPEEGVNVALAIRIGTLFYIEPEGTIKKFYELHSLKIEKKSVDIPLGISLEFQNIGNVDITCGGTFDIIDKKGVVYGRGEFTTIYTLPGDTAKLIAVWKELVPKGKYDLVITLDLGKALEELSMGRGPIVVKEAEIEIGENGEVISVGALK